ncbi:hypothetical protein BDW74DRAFT_18663 [Aspergillus multicolor]|uniref:uncharacterized protein n=1 Tax=Aspergillus multicolor TaxID=41759 RepID=UPI003CCD33F5
MTGVWAGCHPAPHDRLTMRSSSSIFSLDSDTRSLDRASAARMPKGIRGLITLACAGLTGCNNRWPGVIS